MILHDTWQDSISMTMDNLFLGSGWYEVEKQKDRYLRWSGPHSVSTLQLNPRRDRENRLNMTIYDSASEEIFTDLRLEADGIPLNITLSKKRNPAFVTAVLPKDRSKKKGGKTILNILIPETVQAVRTGQGAENGRKRGIALSRIDIFPLSRSLFTAQKFNDPVPFDGLNYLRHNPAVRDGVIHGIYPSAYAYYQKHDRSESEEAFELHEKFDECPGDLFDILNEEMREQCRRLDEKYQKELNLLRNIVFSQGDVIRKLQGGGPE